MSFMGAKFAYFHRNSLFRGGGGVNSLNCEIQRHVSDSMGEYLLICSQNNWDECTAIIIWQY